MTIQTVNSKVIYIVGGLVRAWNVDNTVYTLINAIRETVLMAS